ncbi:MAG: hypothetical protein Q8K75_12725 [Chlamydiales bacterium]|nr:hypothetical protein [Chlamydiales bacterium]
MEAIGEGHVQEVRNRCPSLANINQSLKDSALIKSLESDSLEAAGLNRVQTLANDVSYLKKQMGWMGFLAAVPNLRILGQVLNRGLILDQYAEMKNELVGLIKTIPVMAHTDANSLLCFTEELLTPFDFIELLKAGFENESTASLVADYIKQSVIQDGKRWQSLEKSPETAWKLDRLVCKVRGVAELLTPEQTASCMVWWSSGMCVGLHLSTSDILAGHLACMATSEQWIAILEVIKKIPDRVESLSSLGTSGEGKNRCQELVDLCLQMNPPPLTSLVIFTSKLESVDSSLARGLWKQVVRHMEEQPDWLFQMRKRVNIEVYPPRWQVEAYVEEMSDIEKVKILEEPKWRFQVYSNIRLMVSNALPKLAFPLDGDNRILDDKGLLDCFVVAACYWIENKSFNNLNTWLSRLSEKSKLYILRELRILYSKSDFQLYYHGVTKTSLEALWDRLIS